jgi:broad specificity phosphatase PhoE
VIETASADAPTEEPRASARLVFVRHGVTQGCEGMCLGHTDPPLSEEGKTQIRRLVGDPAQLRQASPAGVRIVSSDLRRARDSAALIGEALGVDVEVDSRLREMSFGLWDGISWEAIGVLDGPRFEAWTGDWVNVPAPHGEGAQDLIRRAREWLHDFAARTDVERRTTIVVSHAGWIRAALVVLAETPMKEMFDIPVDYAKATVATAVGDNGVIAGSNLEDLATALRG